MARTILYKPGSMITCGQLAVDYVIVDSEEVKSYLKKGWVRTPEETATRQKAAKTEEGDENGGQSRPKDFTKNQAIFQCHVGRR